MALRLVLESNNIDVCVVTSVSFLRSFELSLLVFSLSLELVWVSVILVGRENGTIQLRRHRVWLFFTVEAGSGPFCVRVHFWCEGPGSYVSTSTSESVTLGKSGGQHLRHHPDCPAYFVLGASSRT